MINWIRGICIRLLLKGGEIQMVDAYVILIMNKRRTLDKVPAHLRDAVAADLAALNIDGNGDPIVSE